MLLFLQRAAPAFKMATGTRVTMPETSALFWTRLFVLYYHVPVTLDTECSTKTNM